MTITDADLQGIVDRLAQKGMPGKIAKYLEVKGIRGRTFAPSSCPVALYVTREIAGPTEETTVDVYPTVEELVYEDAYVLVGPTFVRVQEWRKDNTTRIVRARVDLPWNVRWFIRRFDAGKYPNLELNKTY